MAQGFETVTLNMSASAGKIITLSIGRGTVSVHARAECWIKPLGPSDVAPTAPTSSVVPSAGNTSDHAHMVAGETNTFGNDPLPGAQKDEIKYLSVYAIGAGNLIVSAH